MPPSWQGDYYTLPQRWSGLYLEGASDALPPHMRAGSAEGGASGGGGGGGGGAANKRREAKVDEVEVDDKRKQRAAAALARDKAEREAQKKAMELAEAQKKVHLLRRPHAFPWPSSPYLPE